MKSTENPLQKKGKATELSRAVADKLLTLRSGLKKSQREFAEYMDVSFQQYQKYEKARDRVSLEKIKMLCGKLELSLNIFDDETASFGFAESEQTAYGSSGNPEEKELLMIFRLLSKKERKNLLESARQLGKMKADK